jgi:SAM-dependent methyltransferase
VDGIPVLINESNSVFDIQDFQKKQSTYRQLGDAGRKLPLLRRIRKSLQRLMPSLGQNPKAAKNYLAFAELLRRDNPNPTVLVIGGSVLGAGMQGLLNSSIRLIESDISFGPRTSLICDAHDIPFADGAFDGVVAQAMLEHVVDPFRCVEEIHRVLKPNGLVYAETPFMQQVHGGAYDFHRFTRRGHRRLFRRFEEIESGAACGTGMSLAWAYKFFLRSLTKSEQVAWCLQSVASLTAFWLPYLDAHLIDKPFTLDGASAFYFIGRRSNHVLSDRELVRTYPAASP